MDDYIRAGFAILRSTNAISSASIASASTTDLGSSDGQAVTVTGTATITSFGTTPSGIVREVTFSGVCTLVNSASIQLAGAINRVTAAGDVMIFRSLGSGNWKQVTSAPIGYTPVNKAGDSMTGTLVTTGNLGAGGGLFVGSATNAVLACSASGGIINLQPNGSTTNQVFIDSAGKINGNAATFTGQVRGNSEFLSYCGTAFSQQIQIEVGWSNGVSRWKHVLEASAAYALYSYDSAGSLIGNPFSLTQAGAGVFSASVSAPVVTQTSDARLKDIHGTFEPRDLGGIRIADYSWKATGNRGVSPIAQEVREIAPEYVMEAEDGTLSVDKAGLALERVAYLEGVLKKAGLL